MIIKTDLSSSGELQQRISKIFLREFRQSEKSDALHLLLGSIDYTSLEGSDTDDSIHNLCSRAKKFHTNKEGMPNAAAVCIYPTFVKLAKADLRDSGVAVAAVAGAFPSGQMPISIKLAEINYATDQGAEEIDMVISRGLFLEGRHEEVFNEIAAIRKATQGVCLKVILETGELITPGNIRLASEMAIQAGADFICTSTGKITPASTEEAVLVIIDVIKEYHDLTGKMIGIKPAGGIGEPGQALRYFQLVQLELGPEWLNRSYFRLGANCLADELMKLMLTETA